MAMKSLVIFLLLLPCLSWGQTDSVTKDSQIEINKDSIYTFVEKMPEFPGGSDNLYKFLGNNVKYPKSERKKNIEAKVLLTFVVGKDGKIIDPKVVNDPPPAFANECLRVIGLMPNWIPGKLNNEPVNVKYTLPIKFQIN